MPPVDDKIMTFRLAADGFYNGRVQPVTAAFAQRASQVGIIILSQAHV